MDQVQESSVGSCPFPFPIGMLLCKMRIALSRIVDDAAAYSMLATHRPIIDPLRP